MENMKLYSTEMTLGFQKLVEPQIKKSSVFFATHWSRISCRYNNKANHDLDMLLFFSRLFDQIICNSKVLKWHGSGQIILVLCDDICLMNQICNAVLVYLAFSDSSISADQVKEETFPCNIAFQLLQSRIALSISTRHLH